MSQKFRHLKRDQKFKIYEILDEKKINENLKDVNGLFLTRVYERNVHFINQQVNIYISLSTCLNDRILHSQLDNVKR